MTVPIALFVGFILSAAFLGLVAIVIPGVLLMAVAGLGMLVFFAVQYFLWAKWLYPIVVRMESLSTADQHFGANETPQGTSETTP